MKALGSAIDIAGDAGVYYSARYSPGKRRGGAGAGSGREAGIRQWRRDTEEGEVEKRIQGFPKVDTVHCTFPLV